MLKLAQITLLLFTIGLFSNCSYVTQFYILNQSDQVIEIEYKTSNSLRLNINARIIEAKRVRHLGEVISEVESINNIVVCKLLPKQGLVIGHNLNFTLENPKEAGDLNKSFEYFYVRKNGQTIIDTGEKPLSSYFKTINLQTIAIIVK
ncbi:MAG: hypothetical protein COA58_14705 [Bacteroidetes bacterium]|nr:MAG: hypothetical protein COA58_14705 [Bacteroidota bacterium]